MKITKCIITLFISAFLIFTSCSEDFLFDFLLGPQPRFIGNEEYIPGLNILGIIRPDSLDSKSLSYILVEKVIPAVSNVPDSFNVIDARVMVYRIMDDIAVDSFEFYYDTTQLFPSIYRPQNLQPRAGDTYYVRCTREGLPEVTATTTVPDVPVIENDNVVISENSIRFTIVSHPSAAMYDVVLLSGSYFNSARLLQSTDGNTPVEISYSGNLGPDSWILIYAYDTNLSDYLTSPNIFIKPNTYRPFFTTVNGGYGCFGSMNLLIKEL
jgi:hypothetical protein